MGRLVTLSQCVVGTPTEKVDLKVCFLFEQEETFLGVITVNTSIGIGSEQHFFSQSFLSRLGTVLNPGSSLDQRLASYVIIEINIR